MGFIWRKGLKEKPDKRITLTDKYFEKIDDTRKVFDIFNDVLNSEDKLIELDFSLCKHISVTGITILAALAPLISKQGRKLIIHLNENNIEFSKHLFYEERNNQEIKTLPFTLLNDRTVVDVLDGLKRIPAMKCLKDSFIMKFGLDVMNFVLMLMNMPLML